MSPAKQQQLYDRYPDLFREKDLPMTQTCMCWGIECGGGWFKVIDKMCAQLDAVRGATGLDVAFGQVKQKFGGLRVYRGAITFPEGVSEAYVTTWAAIVNGIITAAEHEAANTCEETGAYGTMHVSPRGWFRTLSAAKAKELGYVTAEVWANMRAAKEAKV